MDEIRDIVAANFRNVEKAAAPLVALATPVMPDTRDGTPPPAAADAVLSSFVRFMEITCMIFFRAVEQLAFGSISASIGDCLNRMHDLSFIADTLLWTEMTEASGRALQLGPGPERSAMHSRVCTCYAGEISLFLERVRVYLSTR